MTYHRASRPIGDNAGTSIDLIPARRRRRRAVGGMGGFFDELLAFTTGASTGIDPALIDIENAAPPAVGGQLSFNTTRFPGICKPMDKTTLLVVTGFQRQMNRVAQMKGFSKIATDGDLGPQTMALFRQVQGASVGVPAGNVMGDGSSCVGIAADLARITGQIASFGDFLGAPSTVSSPATFKTPSFINPAGVEVKVPGAGGGGSLIDTVKNMPTSMKLALGGIAVGIGYFAFFDKRTRARR